MKLQRVAPIFLLAALAGGPRQMVAQGMAGDSSAVMAVADSALAAVSRGDFAAFADLMLDSAVTFSAGMRQGQYRVRFQSRADTRATTARAAYTERGFQGEVRISGPIAMVWLPYDFYLDGKWSHCGVDVFTLVKSEAGWRIATMGWSVDQPPSCQRHPAGPPPASSGN